MTTTPMKEYFCKLHFSFSGKSKLTFCGITKDHPCTGEDSSEPLSTHDTFGDFYGKKEKK